MSALPACGALPGLLPSLRLWVAVQPAAVSARSDGRSRWVQSVQVGATAGWRLSGTQLPDRLDTSGQQTDRWRLAGSP